MSDQPTKSKSILGAPLRFARRIEAGLRNIAPRSLLGRSILIIVLPVLITQAFMTWFFFDRHWDFISRRLASVTAGEIAMVLRTYESFPETANLDELIVLANQNMRLDITVLPGASLPDTQPSSNYVILDDTLSRELSHRISRPFWFDLTSHPEHVEIRIQMEDGVMQVLARRDRVFVTNGHIFLLNLIFAGALLMGVAFLFLRNQVRPIQRLADAAESFGRGVDVPDFKPAGASEVRSAALAFIQMRDRIYRHIHQRTEMLAGVSHDLRTPLTRMRLELAMMEDDQSVEAVKADVEEMGHMLEEYLEFAKGQRTEQAEPSDLTALLHHIVADMARQNLKIDLDAAEGLNATVRTQAIRRAVNNLLDNAANYSDEVRLTARDLGTQIEIIVDDAGPGIPEHQREEVFLPFKRLDESRNKESGEGVGLGLSIARDIARSHGGDITLSDSPLGGLRARFVLPT